MGHGFLSLAELREIDLFDDSTDEELRDWLAVTVVGTAEPGDILNEQGTKTNGVWFLLEGEAETLLIGENGNSEPVGRQYAPTWMGAISVMTGSPSKVRMQARTECRVAKVGSEVFYDLVLKHPAVHHRVMAVIAPVAGRFAAMEQNKEKMASLGTMAAGLAHELNNPAAAARRAAQQMTEVLDTINSTLRRFVESGVSLEQAAALLALHKEAVERAHACTVLSALDAADAEDALTDMLDDLGVAEGWKLAESLASVGVDERWLRDVSAAAGPATDAALRWVAASITALGLAAELADSTDRMSTLVKAVKSYAYVDRGDVVEVDVHEGLESTVIIMGHKLKQTTIEIVRDYDKTLPKLTVRGSELNQVWTNLIDNAIDAMGESGTLTLKTSEDNGCALIEITDTGPGIPAEIRSQIFDSFFTTKDVGQGTGLGLATAHRIVVDRHGGSLTVESQPGKTTFRVWLPLTQPA